MGFPLLDIVAIGGKLIDKLIPDPKARAEAVQKLKELEAAGDLAQLNADLAVIQGQVEINKIEAAHSNMFVSGWRPAVGWICGAALAVQLLIGPLVAYGLTIAGNPHPMPVMQTELLTTLLVGMLGLGGMRTIERLNNVANGQKEKEKNN